MPLVKKVASSSNETHRTPLDLVLSSSQTTAARNHHVLLNYVPHGGGGMEPRKQPREPSPDLIEIQAQIEAIR